MKSCRHAEVAIDLEEVRNASAKLSFFPFATIRCLGQPLFRSRTARDYGCLLDLDTEVDAWTCLPIQLVCGSETHIPDFLIESHGRRQLASITASPLPESIQQAALHETDGIKAVHPDQLGSIRLTNARDLLRYGRWRTPLGDRVRLLALLEEFGSLTLAEAMSAFQETSPIPGIASLVLHRFVEMDLDESLIGPETVVRRPRD